MRTAQRRETWILLALLGGVIYFWESTALLPLRLLVVFFHEMSHAAAAIITGGSVEEIALVAGEGGHCVTRGGIPFIILSAGYLGSLAWGGAILLLAARGKQDRAVAAILGGILVLTSLLLVRPVRSFGFGFGVAAGAAMIAMAGYLPLRANDIVLKLVGLTSCLYAVLDVKSDILDRPGAASDARMLAERTGVPVLAWGILWIAIQIGGAFYFLRVAARGEERR